MLATVLLVMTVVPLLEARIPAICCPVAEVDAVPAFKLFAVVRLPSRFPDIVGVPDVTLIPTIECEVDVVDPNVVTEPTVLFEIVTVPEEEECIM